MYVMLAFNQTIEDKNFYYLSGIEEHCKGVVVYDGEARVIASPLESEIAKKYVNTSVYKDSKEFWELLIEETKSKQRIGLDFSRITLSAFDKLKKNMGCEFYDVSKKLKEMRMIKNKDEIEKIRKAGEIASECIEEIREFIQSGVTELEIKAELERIAIIKGVGNFGFETIIASGKNSAIPHAVPSTRKIRKGDVILIDFGPSYKMYFSDISRTFRLGKDVEFTNRYESVLEAQKNVIDAVYDGTVISDLQEVSEKTIGKMIHALGHGLGLDIHEAPSFSKKTKLIEGNVFTIEPGIYDKFGVRIEDVVNIAKKSNLLTNAPKNIDFAVI